MANNSGDLFLKSILKFSVASWVQAGIALISIPLVTRAFSPGEYGKINMFTLTVSIVTVLVGMSLDQSYVRFFKEKESEVARAKMLSQFICLSTIAFIIFLIFNIIWGKYLSVYLFGEYNFIVTQIALPLMIIITLVNLYQTLYFRMSENALGYGVISILTVFATKICLVFAALFYANYTSGIIFTVVGFFLLVAGYIFFYRKSFQVGLITLDKFEIIPYLKYSLPLLPVAIFSIFNNTIIRFLLKDYLSYTALGIFTITVSIASLLSVVQVGFTTYWTPFMYENYKKEVGLIKKIHSGISFLMISISLLIILFNDVIFLLLDEEYKMGKSIFGFLLIPPAVYTISETTCYGIYINKKTHLQFYCTIYSFVITTVLGFLLIPNYGILGAALANAAGGIVFFFSRTYYGLKEYNSAEKISRTYFAVLILFVAGLINYTINILIVRSLLISILLLIIVITYLDIIKKGYPKVSLIFNKLLNRPN